MKNSFKNTTTHILLVLLAMLYGMLSQQYQLFPYHLINRANDSNIPANYTLSSEARTTNVTDLIRILTPEDVFTLRHRLVTFLWGEHGLPSSFPAINPNFDDFRYNKIADLKSIRRLVVRMEFGLESYVYHLEPKAPNNKVILYHEGHRGDFYQSKKQIAELLRAGFSVVAFCMPLLGLNNQPVVDLPGFGKVKLSTHDHMKFLSTEGHPIKYFVEPVVVVLNYLERDHNYDHTSMVGISGGGWTTTLAAAIDERIKVSVPVAGSYPIYLRFESMRDWGDWEQTEPRLYKIANYLELYVLGAYGINRKQLQMINEYDPCCFSGTKWKSYKDIVASRVLELGAGQFDLVLDNSHRGHAVSKASVQGIITELKKR